MASRIAEAYVQIVPRIDGISSKLNTQLSDEMGKSGEVGATSFAGGFKKIAGPAIAAAIAIAGTALVRFGIDSIKAAEDARVASKRIDTIAESMNLFGSESKAVSSRIQEYAESQERLLAVDADVIKGTQAKLLTFKELAKTADTTGGAFDRATIAAVDLAAAGFGSAESNAIQLGKALNDPIKGISALTRSGITFTESEKEKIKTLVESGQTLEAQNMILGAIETQVGGTAAATATSSEKMRLGFESVKDAVGAALLPAFDKLATFMSTNVFPSIVAGIEKLPALFTAAGDALAPFVDGFKATFENAGGGVSGFITAMMELRQKLFDALINALPGIIDAIVAFIPMLVENTVKMITSLITAITDALPAIIDGAIQLFNGIITGLLEVLPVIITAVVEALPTVINAIVEAIPLIIQGAIKLFLGVIDGLIKALPVIITALVNALPTIIKAITDALPLIIKGAIKLFLGIIDGLTKALPQIIDALIEALPEIVQALIDAIPLFIDAGFQLVKGLVKGIIDNAPKLVKAAIEGIAELATSTFKKLLGIKSPSTVFYDYGENIVEGLKDGVMNVKGGWEDLMKQLAKDGVTSFMGTATGLILAMDPLMAAFSAAFDPEASTELKTQGNELREVIGSTSIQGLLDKISGGVSFGKGNKQISIGGNLESEYMKGYIQDLLDQGYKQVKQPKGTVENIIDQVSSALAPKITSKKDKKKKMARGGYVDGPTNALIGEYGPEVVVPLNKFEKWMGLGQGNGKTVNYYAAPNNSIDSEQALLQAMRRSAVVSGW